jgi:ABC-type bacteriocin/lantibiotic exporter with double-glycine peptidase domain
MKQSKITVNQAFKEFIWPRRGIVSFGLVLIVISRLSSLVLPLKSKELLDEIIPNKDYDALFALILVVMLSEQSHKLSKLGYVIFYLTMRFLKKS